MLAGASYIRVYYGLAISTGLFCVHGAGGDKIEIEIEIETSTTGGGRRVTGTD